MKNNKLFFYLFLLLPLLDVITSLYTRNIKGLMSPGLIIKGIILLVLTIYTLFITKSKYKKTGIFVVILVLVYLIGYFVTKPLNIHNPFILQEMKYLFRLVFFPLIFCNLLCFFDENNFNKNFIKKAMLYTLGIYAFLLIIPIITKTAYNTYPVDWKGYVGWFYAGNEIANIMVLLLPYSLYLLDKNKYSFLAMYPLFAITMTIGTKVSTFGPLIIAILASLLFILKKNRRNAIICISIALFLAILIPKSYAITNYKIAYSNTEKIEITIDEENKKEIDIINKKISKFYDKNQFNGVLKNLLNGRDILLANTLSVYNDNKSIINRLFGIGFSNTKAINNSNVARLVEIDILDGYFHYGIIGLLIMIMPFLITIKYLIKLRKNISLFSIYLIFTILLICGISTFSGHVLAAPAVSIYLVITILLLLDSLKVFKRKVKNNNKVSILALHMGYGGIERSITNQANMISKEYEVEIVSLYKLYDKIPYKMNDNIVVTYLSNLKPNREDFLKALKKKQIFKLIKEGIKSLYILYKKKSLLVRYIYNCDSKVIISSRVEFTELLNNYGDSETIKIAEEHSYHENNKKYLNRVKNSMEYIDYMIPSSKYISEDYKKIIPKEKIVYIPQVVDIEVDSVNKCDNLNIISVGRLSKEKGFTDLIEIMKIVSENNKKIHLTLVGEGTEKRKINNLIEKYNLKNVKLTGFLDTDELDKEYKKASLYVMTSYKESFGLVLIEAMRYGIPCFAFDDALGAKEIINDKNGIIIEDRNKEEMAKKILEYFNESDHSSMIEQARKKSLCYEFSIIQKEWLKFLDNISN